MGHENKPKLKTKDFIAVLLTRRDDIDKSIKDYFLTELGFHGDRKFLNLDIAILSLWIITLTIPDKYRSLLHEAFCEDLQLIPDAKMIFYEELNKRYKNYFDAFSMWQKNHRNGHTLGGVIIEIIKNQNPNFSIKNSLPIVGVTEAFNAFVIFMSSYTATLELIKELKKTFEIEGFESNEM